MGITKANISKLTGLSTRNVQFYYDNDIMREACTGGGGSRGSAPLEFTEQSLVEWYVIAELAKCGTTLPNIKKIMKFFRKYATSLSEMQRQRSQHQDQYWFVLEWIDDTPTVSLSHSWAEVDTVKKRLDRTTAAVVLNLGKIVDKITDFLA